MKKAGTIIKNIFVGLMLLLAIAMMVFTVISVNTFDQNSRSLFGYQFFIVRSDSMSATDFDAGDLVIVKNAVNPADLKEGDIIAYTSQNAMNFGETVTHKIRSLTTTPEGEPGFVTYGTTTETDDETIVTYPYVIGKYVGSLPSVGTFFAFLKSTPGYVLCILLPFLLLIGYHALNCALLFRQYRKEQMEELNAERKKLAEERKRSEEMLAELRELKKRLGKTDAEEVPESAETQKEDIEIIEL